MARRSWLFCHDVWQPAGCADVNPLEARARSSAPPSTVDWIE